MDTNGSKSPFSVTTLIDRDDAIAFLKKVGFVETEKAGIFMRDSVRKTSQRGAAPVT